MKKPTKNTNFALQVHHLVEAMHDSMRDELAGVGMTEDMVNEELENPGVHQLSPSQAAAMAAFVEISIMHTAIHDLMEHQDLNKLSDKGLRRTVLKHKSSIEERLDEEQLRTFREGLGL